MGGGGNEHFCLRWNDFESNISHAFREIRDEKDFFDVTLACEDEQVQAHKVILSACSPFFRKILRKNPHQHPLLFLKGVKYAEIVAILNFMYHGEVNVTQDDLNAFLAVAEELKVKGLTQDGQQPKSQPLPSPSFQRPAAPSPQPSKRPRVVQQPPASQPARSEEEVQEVAAVKCEPPPSQPAQEQPEVNPSHYMEEYAGYEDGYEEGSEEGAGYDESAMAQGLHNADGNKGELED